MKKEWLSYIPGIVKGIGLVVNALLRPDEKVIIQPPVYHPFRLVPQGNHREVVFNPLKLSDDGRYEMDFEQLESVCDEKCRLLILSNPHNPAGQFWPAATLRRLADFCYEHHITVISDEIHCDMPLFGHRHTPFATVSERAADISITFQAPTKTFNMAGVVTSFAIVPNAELRQQFYGWLKANEFESAHLLAPIATMAAYSDEGETWRKQLTTYLEGNVEYVENYCKTSIPQVIARRPEASYLVWLDCRRLNLNHAELVDLFVNRARLALNDGEMFGPEGAGFMRMNIGVPRQVLHQALQQLAAAVNGLSH